MNTTKARKRWSCFEKGMKKLFQAPKVAQWAYRELLARAFSPPNLSWRDALGRCPRLV